MSALAARRSNDSGREFDLSAAALSEIIGLVRSDTGIHLTDAKGELIYSRLAKRLRVCGLADFGSYLALIKSKPGIAEREEMVSAITTNVTNFNREPHHFEHFRQTALPDLVSKLRQGKSVRIWSAGCSDGREPFTLAFAILDAFPDAAKSDFRILATDIDKKSLATASSGIYSSDKIRHLPDAVAKKWFDNSGDELRVKDTARQLIRFNRLNLMGDWPMRRKFDAMFCRNVLIYFENDVQSKLFSRFADGLNDQAYMYIGHSERVIGPAEQLFKPVGITTYQFHANGHAT